MRLDFLQPLAFLGLLAAVVPVIIHLLEKRRRIIVSIPTARFILEAHRRTYRRLRVRRWLLLVLRLLMIVILSFIMARPRLTRPEAVLHEGRPASLVVVVDDSPSMAAVGEVGDLWSEALRAAEALATAAVKAGGEAAVIAAGGRDLTGGFARRPVSLAEADGARADWAGGNLAAALNAAYRRLAQAAFPKRSLVFITDLARPEWLAFDHRDLANPDRSVSVRIIDIRRGRESWNRAVTALAPVPDRSGGMGAAKVSLASWGQAPPGETTLTLEVDGRITARTMVTAPSGGETEIDFPLPPLPAGSHLLTARLDKDLLPWDDAYHAVFEYGGQVNVITVDGSPSASLNASETYFLRSAIVPDRSLGGRRLAASVVSPEALAPALLTGAKAVLLANVRNLDPAQTASLADWVNSGGGLVIFLGDNYQQGVYQESLDRAGADLLPAFLGQTAQPSPQARLRLLDRAAGPLRVFQDSASGDFGRAAFGVYVALGPGGLKPGARVLMAFDEAGREPFLIEREVGRGRVLLFTSSADLDWNTLPTQPVFLPLVQRSLEHVTGDRGLVAEPDFKASATVRYPASAGPAASVDLVTPGGERRRAQSVITDAGPRLVFAADAGPGFYSLFLPQKEQPVAVNVMRTESDLSRVPPERLEALKKLLPVEVAAAGRNIAAEGGLTGTTDPSPWLWAVLAALLFGEGLAALGRRRPSEAEKGLFYLTDYDIQ